MADAPAAAPSAPAAPSGAAGAPPPIAASPTSSPGLPGVIPDDAPPLPGVLGAARQPDVQHEPMQDEVPEVAPAKPTRFTFAGEEYESQEAAEQNFRSLRGQFKPLQAVAKQVGGVDKIATTLASAAESARGWKAEHDKLQAELQALRAGHTPQPPTPATPKPTPSEPEEDIDWDLYAEIKRLATESNEPWKAEQWLINQTRDAERKRVERMIGEHMTPFHEAQARQQIVQQTDQLFSALAEYTLPNGEAAFPELLDENTAYEVGKIWTQLGLAPEAIFSPQGAIAAVALYRMTNGSQGRQALPVVPPTPVPPASPTQAAVAAGLDMGRPTPTAPDAPQGMSVEAARIKAGLRQAHLSASRGHLGFGA